MKVVVAVQGSRAYGFCGRKATLKNSSTLTAGAQTGTQPCLPSGPAAFFLLSQLVGPRRRRRRRTGRTIHHVSGVQIITVLAGL